MGSTFASSARLLSTSVLVVCAGLSGAQTLRSPWDISAVQVTEAPYNYKQPQPLPKDITASDYYSDAKHSVIDPVRYAAYNAVEKRFRDSMKVVESCADTFQRTGSKEAAEGVLQILELNAQAGAMTGKMSSQQAYYLQNWTIGAFAITWLKVRGAQPGSPEDRLVVTNWLRQVAKSTQGYFDRGRTKGSSDSRNNHSYWAGLAAMSVGVAAEDSELFDWGMGAFNDGISRIQADGTLPLEMSRGKKALHYHLFAMAPLVTMAEFGAANGLDLYKRDDNALTRLINRAMLGLTDNSFFAEKAGVAQDTPSQSGVKSDDVICLAPYLRRYPNPDLNRLLQSVTLKPFNFLGGMPPP